MSSNDFILFFICVLLKYSTLVLALSGLAANSIRFELWGWTKTCLYSFTEHHCKRSELLLYIIFQHFSNLLKRISSQSSLPSLPFLCHKLFCCFFLKWISTFASEIKNSLKELKSKMETFPPLTNKWCSQFFSSFLDFSEWKHQTVTFKGGTHNSTLPYQEQNAGSETPRHIWAVHVSLWSAVSGFHLGLFYVLADSSKSWSHFWVHRKESYDKTPHSTPLITVTWGSHGLTHNVLLHKGCRSFSYISSLNMLDARKKRNPLLCGTLLDHSSVYFNTSAQFSGCQRAIYQSPFLL